ncbi:MAG: diguanylate cyclase [Anaerolineales bacterium]
MIANPDKPPVGSDILAVEDSPTQAEELKYILEMNGHQVTLARDGRQALSLMTHYRPALVISDINMPEMNGFQLCQHLKAAEMTRPIPVILLTALSDVEDLYQGLACGADSFITKPYTRASLLERVEHMLCIRPAGGHPALEVDIALAGKPRVLTADPQRMINLLISAFEAAFRRNFELTQSQQALRSLNDQLEDLVVKRTAVLSAEIAGREETQTALRALSLTDELTGLHNRRGFLTLAEQYWHQAARSSHDFSLLYIDVDDFKLVNDTHGHAEGDLALLAIARLLKQTFRDSDILARFGGDEFAVLLTDCPGGAARAATDRLAASVTRLNAASAGRYSLSLSLGLAQFNPDEQTGIHSLLEQGDAEMYAHKRRLGNRGAQ